MLFTFIIGSFFRIFFCTMFFVPATLPFNATVSRHGSRSCSPSPRLRISRPLYDSTVHRRTFALSSFDEWPLKHARNTDIANVKRKARCEQDDRNARAYIPRKKDIQTNCIVICHSGSGLPGRLVVSSDARGAVQFAVCPWLVCQLK